jgi:hypothetical protein
MMVETSTNTCFTRDETLELETVLYAMYFVFAIG